MKRIGKTDTFLHVEASLIIKRDFDRKWSSAQLEGNGSI
jgi:hypothetical protein